MPSSRSVYQGSVRALALVFCALGVATLAVTLLGGGGPLSTGVLIGFAFLGVGAGRLWLSLRSGL